MAVQIRLVLMFACTTGFLALSCNAQIRTIGTAIKNGRMDDPGKEQTIFEANVPVASKMTYFWMTGGWSGFGDTIVRYYIDGESNSSIQYPLFLGHGIGQDDKAIVPHGTEFMGRLAEGSVYDTNQIPFLKSVKITVESAKNVKGNPTFWIVVRGLQGVPVEFAGFVLPDDARLKIYIRESVILQPLDYITMVDTSVKTGGIVYQATLDGDSSDFNYLEACVRGYFDGDTNPIYLSSGTEDFARSAFYFNKGPYTTPIAALTHFDGKGKMSFYTLFSKDPLIFGKSFKMTWRNNENSCPTSWEEAKAEGEFEHKSGLNTAPVLVNTVVWVYEW